MEDLEWQLKVLQEFYNIKIKTVEWYRGGVRQYKYRISRFNSPFQIYFKYSKDSKFSYSTHNNAVEAAVKYAKKYLEQKHKDDTSY